MPHKDPEERRRYSREYAKKWREANPERYAERRAAWNAANQDKLKHYSRKYYQLNREQEIIRSVKGNQRRYRRLRLEALQHYGGAEPSCACCAEWRLDFLALDHINGGGGKHREELKKINLNIWEFIKREQYPDGFRVLCHNCNGAIGYYGSCPHEDERSSADS